MDRKQFIKNLSFACAALNVPKIFSIKQKAAVSEFCESKGILWYIQHQPTTIVDFSIGSFTIKDFRELADVYWVMK